MIQQQFGDDLRRKIKDDKTYNNVSYYAPEPSYTDADYGTTHLAVLAKNGDAVSVTSTINYRFVSKRQWVWRKHFSKIRSRLNFVFTRGNAFFFHIHWEVLRGWVRMWLIVDWHLSLRYLEQDEVLSRRKSLSLLVYFCIFMVTEPVTWSKIQNE